MDKKTCPVCEKWTLQKTLWVKARVNLLWFVGALIFRPLFIVWIVMVIIAYASPKYKCWICWKDFEKSVIDNLANK